MNTVVGCQHDGTLLVVDTAKSLSPVTVEKYSVWDPTVTGVGELVIGVVTPPSTVTLGLRPRVKWAYTLLMRMGNMPLITDNDWHPVLTGVGCGFITVMVAPVPFEN